MKIWLILLIAFAILMIWCYIENHIFYVHKYEVKDEKLPDGFDGAKIVYISDLHNTSYGKDNAKLKKAIDEEHPDYVMIGGDMISKGDRSFAHALDLLGYLCKKYPVYFSNGNHETKMKMYPEKYQNMYQDFRALTKAFDCTFMDNSKVMLQRGQDQIELDSIELDEGYYKKISFKELSEQDIVRMIGKCQSKYYHILLCHTPNFFESYAAWGADLTLAGHNHGGMARIPGIGGVFSTQAVFFPKYSKGLYEIDDKKMIVSAGLGSHTIKVRFLNPAEVLSITLKKA